MPAVLGGVELLGGAISPVERTAAFVMHGEDLEVAAGCPVDDHIGEANDAHLAFEDLVKVIGAGRGTDVGPGCSGLGCRAKSAKEPITETDDTSSYQSCASSTSAVASGWKRTLRLT